MKNFTKIVSAFVPTFKGSAEFSAGMRKCMRMASLLVLFAVAATNKSYATRTGVIGDATPIVASNNCQGSANVLVYSFSLAQTTTNRIYDYQFTTTSGSATAVSDYYVYIAPSAGNVLTTVPANAYLLGSVANAGPGLQVLPNWNGEFANSYFTILNATTYYIYITANILATAPVASTIVVSRPTTADFSWQNTETAGANTAATGAAASVVACPCTMNFSYNGGTSTASGTVQNYTVPAGCTQLNVVASGSRGGDGEYQTGRSIGGNGATVTSTVNVTPGTALAVYVGNAGSSCIYSGTSASGQGGSNSGGGANGGNGSYFEGGGGGGSSDVRGASGTLASRIVMGGGGGGGAEPFVTTLQANNGGAGGYNGGTGGSQGVYNSGWSSAQDGNPGTYVCCATAGTGGTGGALGAGGAAGSYYDGGGGGGGYYGASGAANGGACGGSSYATTVAGVGTVTATTYTDGNNTGSGFVKITPIFTVTGGPYCSGTAGATIGLTGSVSGATYQLYLVGTGAVGSPVSGTGSAITFGTFSVVGTYTVSASTPVTPMAGSAVVSVTPTPAAISGASSLCGGTTITLSDATAGGTWSSSNITVATVASTSATTGVVTGISGGTAIISYSIGACSASYIVTVTGPAAISGLSYAAVGGTVPLSDASGGGTWSSSNPGIGSISASGVVTGIASGSTTISYTVAGCAAIMTFYVGSAGPASCVTTAASWANAAISLSYGYTGAPQTWTVPAGVSSVAADLQGATGGHDADYGVAGYNLSGGGSGGRLQATLPVTPGQVLNIFVGGAGAMSSSAVSAPGGYNGGGSSGVGFAAYVGGGGGGASDIRIGGTALSNRILVAGGGGGAGINYPDAGYERGGGGGGIAAENGYADNVNTLGHAGYGGTQVCCAAPGDASGGTGALGIGGNATAAGGGGGGGGGGYYGGGSGGTVNWGGGGGGSSYTDPSITTYTHTPGYNSAGNGIVSINYTPVSLSTSYGVDAFFVTAATGSNLSDAGIAAAASSTTGYLDRTALAPITLYTGMSFASSITWGNATSYQEAQVWIDFNNDGIFQTTEEVTGVLDYSTTSTTNPIAFNIAIPAGAPTGLHRMRVRGVLELSGTYALSSHLDPCLVQYLATNPKYNDGDEVDYSVLIQNEPPCAGTPVAGTASVTPSSGGGATSFTLSLTGYTLATGITFQWQSSPDGSAWTNITGATTVPYTFTGISANTYYRCVVTCSGSSSNSNSVLATFIPTPSCTPTAASWSAETGYYFYGASSFSVTGYSGSTLNDASIQTEINTTTGYSSEVGVYPTLNLQQAGTYSGSINWQVLLYHQQAQVWIDFNNDGTFSPSEEVTPVSGYVNYPTFTTNPTVLTLTIPAGAATGVHLMRMRSIVDQFASDPGVAETHLDPCLEQYPGQPAIYVTGTATDYYVNIVPVGCTGTPTAGTTSTSISSACTTISPTLTLTGASSLPGITYQWQSSPTGIAGSYVSIGGATSTTYVPTVSSTTYFRCNVTCTTSAITVSSTVTIVTVNPAPTITSASNSSPTCVGNTITLTANSPANVATYAWTGPVVVTSSASAVATVPAAPLGAAGTYTVTLNNGVGAGCTVSYTTVVTMNPNPAFSGLNSAQTCYNATLAQNMSFSYGGVTGGPDQYTLTGWSPAGPLAVSTFTTFTPPSPIFIAGGVPAGTAVGTYTATFTIKNSSTTCTSTATAILTVNPLPVAVFTVSPGATTCTGTTVTYGVQTGYLLYNWSIPGVAGTDYTLISGGTGLSNTATISWTTTGSKTVSVTCAAPPSGLCSSTATNTTNVVASPTATVSSTGSPLCVSGTVTLNATPSGSVTGYSWTGPNLSSATVQNPTATPTATATYSLTVSNAGCSPSTVYTTTVTVNNPTAAPTNNGPICSVGTVNLTANPAGGVTTYSWTGPNLSSSIVPNPTATPTATATYSLTVGMPGCSPATVYTTTVTVNPAPTITSASNNSPVCVGGTFTLTANSPANVTSYAWTGPVAVTSSTTAVATVTGVTLGAAGTYTVTLTNGVGSGCTASYTTVATVNPTPAMTGLTSTPVCYSGSAAHDMVFAYGITGGADQYTLTGWSPAGPTTISSFTALPSTTLTITGGIPASTPSGIYNGTFTIKNSTTGCTSTTAASVTVNANPAVSYTVAPAATCTGTTVTYATQGGYTSYNWTVPGGHTVISGGGTSNNFITLQWTASGIQTVSVDVFNSSSCDTSITATTNVSASPTASVSNNGPLCGLGTVTLTATPSGTVTAYSWTGPNLSSATDQNPTATPTVTATYSLTVSNTGCSPSTVYTTTVTVNNPTAAPTNSGPICSVGTVTLTANPAGGTTTYSWSGPNLSSATVQNPTATPTATATYSLTVGTVGCSPVTVYTTTVSVVPAPTAAPSNNSPICNGGTVNLTANPAGGATTYSWTGPNLSSATIANPTATPTTTATYSLTVGNPGCPFGTVFTTIVTVNPTPSAAPTNSSPICVGTVTLTATPSGGATSFSWTGPAGYTSSLQNPVITPVSTGIYSLTVSSVGTSGCNPATVYTTMVTVNTVASAAPSGEAICNGGTESLFANPSGGTATTFTWAGANLSSTTVQNPTANPTITSTYSLVVGAPGCAPSPTYTVLVTVAAQPSISALSSSATNPFCVGGVMTLTATSAGGAGNPVYSWSGPDITATTSATNVSPSFTTSGGAITGSYHVTLAYDGPGCITTAPFASTVYTITAAPSITGLTSSASNPFCGGASMTLTAAVGAGGAGTPVYTWSGPGIPTTTANSNVSPSIVTSAGAATGAYSVSVAYTTTGCGSVGPVVSSVYTLTAQPSVSALTSSATNPMCVGGVMTLTATSAGGAGAPTYTWSGPDITTFTSSSNPSPSVTTAGGATTGKFSVTFSTAGTGCNVTGPVSTSVYTITAAPTLSSLSSSISNPFCAGAVITLSATSGGGTGSPVYTWSGPDITTTTSGTSVSPALTTSTVSVTGAYSLSVAYSATGCVVAPITSSVYTVTAQPAITGLTASPSNPFCVGASVVLTATSTGGAGASMYTWNGPDISLTTSSSNISPSIPTSGAATSGAFSVKLHYSGDGCVDAPIFLSSVYSVNDQPSLTGISSSATNPMCVGGVMTLTATSAGGAGAPIYTWSGPDITTTTSSTNPSPSFTTTGGAATGTYNVTYSTAGTGCNAAGPVSTGVYTITPAPTLSGLTSTASNPFCAGATMTLTATSSGGAGSPVYTWSGPDITTATSGTNTSPSFVTSGVPFTGTYSVSVAYPTTGCVSAPAVSASYTANAQPSIGSLTASTATLFCAGSNLTLTANVVAGGAGTSVYTWSGPGITATTGSSSTSPLFNPTAATGAYSVVLNFAGTGCNSAAQSTASIYTVAPTPALTTVSGGGTFCGNTTINAAGGAGGSIYFQGTTSGGTSTAVLSASQVVSVTGTYYFRSQSAAGCWGPQGSVAVTINPVPSAAPTSNGPICAGGTVNLSAVPGANTTTYTWSGSNIGSTTSQNTTATPIATSVYSLTVTDGSGLPGCSPATVYTVSVTVNAAPTAGPTNNGYICNGGTVALTAHESGSASAFTWSGANITGSTTTNNTTATPTTTSTYTLTVTNGTAQPGCSATYTTSVTVNGAPTAAPTSNGPICNGGTVTLVGNGSGTTSTYAWSGASITSSSTTSSITATPSITSVYTLVVTDGSAQPGCANQYTKSVTVNAAPTAAPSNNGYICNGGTVTLNANPGTATTFAWTGASITGSTSGATTTATPSVTSTYTVVVTDGTGNPGCSNQYTTTVSVNAAPAAAPSNNGYICNGGTVTLLANGSGGATVFAWTGSALVSGSGATTTANPIATSVYSVTASDGSGKPGCISAAFTTTVTVNAAPTAAPSNNGYICVGGTAQLLANQGGSTSTYLWAGTNITGSTITNNTTATPTGTAVYTLTVSDGSTQPGCVKQYTTTVNVNPTPTAAPTNDGYICNGGTVNLSANPANGASTFIWSGASILGSTTTSTTTADPSATSTYSLTVTDGSGHPGCSPATIYTTTVTVHAAPTAAPTNDGYICIGGTVDLSANGANGASVFTWSGASLNSLSGATTTANPVATSTYSLTVTDGSGKSGCSPATIYTTTVSVNATPVAAPSNDGPICVGGTVNLAANPAGGATNFVWSGINLSSTSIATPTATPTVTGTYSLTVSDGSLQPGCAPATIYTTTVTVKAVPQLSSASNNSPICATSDLVLTANDPVNVTDYSWSGPVGITITNPSSAVATVLSATTDASGLYKVIVNNGTGSGCAASYLTTATVNPLPAVFNVTGGGGYCASDTGVHVGLDGSQTGVNYQLYIGASGLGTLPGNGSALDFGLQTAVGTYTVLATNASTSCTSPMNSSAIVSINPVPVNTYSLTSSGHDYCFGGAGVIVSLSGSDTGINYQLFLGSYPVGGDTAGTGSAISFGYETGAGDYLAIATNAHTGCHSMLTGSVSIVIDSLPHVYSVTGGGGYCAGGAGVDIGLSNSDTGITYNMYNSGTPGIVTDPGSGHPLDFGMQTAAGTVTVVATNNATGCHDQMAGTPAININPLPNIYSVTGGGTYCEGTGGVPVGVATGDTGVVYSLYNGTSLVTTATGSGAPLTFGLQTAAGTYTVSALRTFTGCSAPMADSAVIVKNPAPTIYTVTGGGPYCSGDAGVALGLGGSDTGVTYTLYNVTASVGTFTGTGTSLSFGTYPAGSYSVSAANNITGCTSDMSGIRLVTMNATPAVHHVTGGGSYCAGGSGRFVFLDLSDIGVNYQLFRDGTPVDTFSGTGVTLNFGSLTTAGTYTVSAINATTGCGSNMADSAVVSITTPVTPSISVSTGIGDTSCTGNAVTFTATGTNGGGSPAYSWSVNGTTITGASTSVYTYTPFNGDNVVVTMTSSAACATPPVVTDTTIITVLEHQTPGVTISAIPGSSVCTNTTVTFTAVPAFGGANPTFVWKKNGVTIVGVGGPVYSYVPLDGDHISVEMTSNYPCLTTDTASGLVAMRVGAEIAPVVEIIAMPGTAIHVGELDTLIANVISGGPVTYQWLVNNGAVTGATNATYISTFNNNDSVTCQVTSSNGCALTGFNTVHINVFNVGVNSLAIGETNLRLVPNPNKGEFSISGTLGTTLDEEVTMEITDMLGQVIYKNKITVRNGVMDEKIILSNTLSNGMYIMNLGSSGGNKVFHFVVEQ